MRAEDERNRSFQQRVVTDHVLRSQNLQPWRITEKLLRLLNELVQFASDKHRQEGGIGPVAGNDIALDKAVVVVPHQTAFS